MVLEVFIKMLLLIIIYLWYIRYTTKPYPTVIFFLGKNIFSYFDLEKLGEKEFNALLMEIPSDSESIDGLDEEEEENSPVSGMDIENVFDMEDVEHIEANVATIEHNISDSDEDTDDNLPLSHFLPNDKFIWKKPEASTYFSRPINDFSEITGPVDIPEDIETPVDIFMCLVDVAVLENIVFQTNLYATQNGKPFVPTTFTEIKMFLAINVLMGLKKLPSYRDYWATQMELRDSYISSLMSRTRFDWLLGNFHLNNNVLQPRRGDLNFDKLYKVRPFLDALLNNFKKYYKMNEIISIDESMICFKGRSSIRQYMPKKPIKWGYKIWTRADINGYIDEFQIYTGKVADMTEKQLGPRIIKDMTRSLVGKNYRIYFDNYFTTLPLLRELKKDNILATGTIRNGRRGIPDNFKPDKELKRGNFDYRVTDDGISCVKWMDKRIVMLASNFESPFDTESVIRKNKNGEKENVPCPKVLKSYNQNMGFVDKADMLKKTYQIDRKSRKWWPRIFWHFIDVSIVNAFIIFQQRSPNSKSINLKTFRLAVVTGLVGAGTEKATKGRTSTDKNTVNNNNYKPVVPLEKRWDQSLHMPVYGTYRRCAFCSTRDQQRRSKWACDTCKVALCLSDKKNCFKPFHAKK